MNIELEIKSILFGEGSIEEKANKICKVMSWNRDELIKKMEEYGTTSKDALNKIINYFWKIKNSR